MTNTGRDQRQEALAEKIDRSSRSLELADPDKGLGKLGRTINQIVEAIGVLALLTIVSVVFANAAARYLLNFSFTWAEELVQMTIPWLAMSGVFLSVRRGTMIRIDYFFEKMPGRLRRFVAHTGLIFNCLVLAMMAFVTFEFVSIFGGDKTLYVGLPTGAATSALVFGAAGAAMAYAAAFVSAVSDGAPTGKGGKT
ncbi:MAG: TRAP transporter small permease [Roseibium sp.]|nr:TRAP transporter small permease [Roseibium sp.]